MPRKPRRCKQCPIRDKNGVCVGKAQWVYAFHPSCPYGRRTMNNAPSAEYQRRKYGWKKRAPKPRTEEKAIFSKEK